MVLTRREPLRRSGAAQLSGASSPRSRCRTELLSTSRAGRRSQTWNSEQEELQLGRLFLWTCDWLLLWRRFLWRTWLNQGGQRPTFAPPRFRHKPGGQGVQQGPGSAEGADRQHQRDQQNQWDSCGEDVEEDEPLTPAQLPREAEP